MWLFGWYGRFRTWLDGLIEGRGKAATDPAREAAPEPATATATEAEAGIRAEPTIETTAEAAAETAADPSQEPAAHTPPPQQDIPAGIPPSLSAARGLLPLFLVYGVALILLAALLNLIQGDLFHIPTLLVHLAVVLVAFDRTHPGRLVDGFLERWHAGDYEACLHYLERERGPTGGDVRAMQGGVDVNSPEQLAESFGRQLTYRCFETMFVVFFWYVLLGPLAVLFSYISYHLQDYHLRHPDGQPTLQWLNRLVWLLEWIPLRLLALTFSLAGDFVRSFKSFGTSLWKGLAWDEPNDETLYSYATNALEDKPEDGREAGSPESRRETLADKILSLQALLERSQLIWLLLLAAVTLFSISGLGG